MMFHGNLVCSSVIYRSRSLFSMCLWSLFPAEFVAVQFHRGLFAFKSPARTTLLSRKMSSRSTMLKFVPGFW